MEEEQWMEKYRPKRLADLVGNPKAIRELKKWAEGFREGVPSKPGAILYGPPGVGKTSAALALAEEYGWVPIELNASDARNMEAIRKVATRGSMAETFSGSGEFLRSSEGRRKLIILDEVDNLYEGGGATVGGADLSDRGGKRAILELLKLSSHPVVLICNDLYGLTRGSTGKAIQNMCVRIKFNRLSKVAIKSALRRILLSEGIEWEEGVLDEIAERSEGDLRAAVVDLQSVALGKRRVGRDDLLSLGYRDRKKNIFEVLAKIFRSNSLSEARKALGESDESPDMLLAWIVENVPLEARGREELSESYNWLSLADLMLGRARWKGIWRMWAFAMDFMSGGVSTALKGGGRGFTPYRFPSWILKMSSSKEMRGMMKVIGRKIGAITHSSTSDVIDACLGPYRVLFQRDREFAVYITAKASLTAEEVSFISGGEISISEAQKIVEEAKRIREGWARPHMLGSGGLMDSRWSGGLSDGEMEEEGKGGVLASERNDGVDVEGEEVRGGEGSGEAKESRRKAGGGEEKERKKKGATLLDF